MLFAKRLEIIYSAFSETTPINAGILLFCFSKGDEIWLKNTQYLNCQSPNSVVCVARLDTVQVVLSLCHCYSNALFIIL